MSEQIALGRMVGYASMLVGGIVKGMLCKEGDMPGFSDQESDAEWDEIERSLYYGVRLGVVLAENLFRNGYGYVETKWKGKEFPNPYKRVCDDWFKKAKKKMRKMLSHRFFCRRTLVHYTKNGVV